MLRSTKEACVPYADGLAQKYKKTEPRVMRDYDKLLELIKMSAFLHQKQRPTFERETSEGIKQFIIATECDYTIGADLFEHIRETTVTGLPQPVIDFFEKVFCKIDGDAIYQSLMRKYKEVFGKLIGRDTLRRRYCEPLETVGWLDRGKDTIDKRQVIFKKCIDDEENPEKTCESTQSVFKDMFSVDELKEYLEDVEEECAKNKDCRKYIVYEGKKLEPTEIVIGSTVMKIVHIFQSKKELQRGIK